MMNITERLRSTSPRYDHLTGEFMYDVFNNSDGKEAADVIDELVSALEEAGKFTARYSGKQSDKINAQISKALAKAKGEA